MKKDLRPPHPSHLLSICECGWLVGEEGGMEKEVVSEYKKTGLIELNGEVGILCGKCGVMHIGKQI